MLGWLKRTLTITLDVDWIYRVLFTRLAAHAERVIGRGMAAGERLCVAAGRALAGPIRSLLGTQGLFARTWATGSMALGMMVFLLALLMSYYLAR